MSISTLAGAIVTGAPSGIGEATARALHAAGAHPVLAARRIDRLRTLSNELGGAVAVRAGLNVAADVAAIVSTTLERFRRIDGRVNNSGASVRDDFSFLEIPQSAL